MPTGKTGTRRRAGWSRDVGVCSGIVKALKAEIRIVVDFGSLYDFRLMMIE